MLPLFGRNLDAFRLAIEQRPCELYMSSYYGRREPGYVTGKHGVITAHLGATLFPDAIPLVGALVKSTSTPSRSTAAAEP